MTAPRVSVLVAAYNEGAYLREALESISGQTFEDFELVVVEDPSEDDTSDVLDAYEREEPRLVRVTNDERLGFVGSLNRGLDRCRGEFVARMDADDVARSDRLERQIGFLDAHPEVGIVGSYYRLIDSEGRGLVGDPTGRESAHGDSAVLRPVGRDAGAIVTMPESDLAIRWRSLLKCPFGHPTVTFRRSLVDRGLRYSEHFPATEDYDLWTRMLRHTTGRNLPEPLLYHRRDPEGNRSARYVEEQLRDHDKIAYRTIREQLPGTDLTLEDVSRLRVLLRGGEAFAPYGPDEGESRRALADTYLDLLDAFSRKHAGSPDLPAVRRTAIAETLAFVDSPLAPGDVALLARLLARHPSLSVELLRKVSRRTTA